MSPNGRGSVGRGIGIAIALHFLQLAIIPAATFIAPLIHTVPASDLGLEGFAVSVFLWGLTQFLYLGPATWIARRDGKTETMKGILIVAGIGILLNGACDSLLFVR